MAVDVLTQKSGTSDGLVFLDPYSINGPTTGQSGALILDSAGNPVWFRPLRSTDLMNSDFRTQMLDGRPVLTFWQGTIASPSTATNLPPGSPEPGACFYIYDNHYRLVGTLTPKDGWAADVHEFLLTAQGDALYISTKTVPMDLTAYGGPSNGSVNDEEVQEVDLATGKLVFTWDELEHVSLSDSEVPASSADASDGYVWDAFHMNSLEQGPQNQVLISSRNTWAVDDVDMTDGHTLWQLGGKSSSFTFPQETATFSWQHMARFLPGNDISLFDDGCCASPTAQALGPSHGLVLHLDFSRKTAASVVTYFHAPALSTHSQGSFEALANGDEMMGWGAEPYYSEYGPGGNSEEDATEHLLYDVRMPGSNISYRAFRSSWVGTPSDPPSVAARRSGAQTVVFASWNGSTSATAWRVLSGPRPDHLSVVGASAPRTGFETAMATGAAGPYFAVQALGATGDVLGTSAVTPAQ